MSQLFRNLLRGIEIHFASTLDFQRANKYYVTVRVAENDAVVYKTRCQTFVLSLKMAA